MTWKDGQRLLEMSSSENVRFFQFTMILQTMELNSHKIVWNIVVYIVYIHTIKEIWYILSSYYKEARQQDKIRWSFSIGIYILMYCTRCSIYIRYTYIKGVSANTGQNCPAKAMNCKNRHRSYITGWHGIYFILFKLMG